MAEISYADFERVDMRVGLILSAEASPKAKVPAYKLSIDFGPLGVKTSSARLTQLYRAESLVGRRIIAVVNFAPKMVADVRSEVLVLGIVLPGGEDVVLLEPEREAPLGSRIS